MAISNSFSTKRKNLYKPVIPLLYRKIGKEPIKRKLSKGLFCIEGQAAKKTEIKNPSKKRYPMKSCKLLDLTSRYYSSPRKLAIAKADNRTYHKSMSSVKFSKLIKTRSPRNRPIIKIYITNKKRSINQSDDNTHLMILHTTKMNLNNKADSDLNTSIACLGERLSRDVLKHYTSNRQLKVNKLNPIGF